MTLSNEALNVLTALRDAQESIYTRKGAEWGSVYLDNAEAGYRKANGSISRHAFAGYLSTLHEAGLYDSQGDGFFGLVKMAAD